MRVLRVVVLYQFLSWVWRGEVHTMVDEYISIARAREIFLEGMTAPDDTVCLYEKRNERLMWEAGRSQRLANASSGVKDAIHDGAVGQPISE